MDANSSCQLGYAYFRAALNFLQNPHLRARKAATFFHLPEILAHAAINHPELLQNFQDKLGRFCCVGLCHLE